MQELEQLLLKNGASLVGYADLRDLPSEVRQELPFGISIAVALNPQIIAEVVDGPTKEYYDEYKRTNQLLVELTDLAVSFLTDKGFKAVSGRATKEQIDLRYLAAPLPLKTIASKSGLGWVGKSALLVTKQYGSAVRLSGVLTDAELPVADPIVESSCGDCRNCVDACPGHAFTGNQWKAGIDRDELYGCYLCRAAALEQLSRRTGIIDTVCGICVAVCPWTRRYTDSAPASSQA